MRSLLTTTQMVRPPRSNHLRVANLVQRTPGVLSVAGLRNCWLRCHPQCLCQQLDILTRIYHLEQASLCLCWHSRNSSSAQPHQDLNFYTTRQKHFSMTSFAWRQTGFLIQSLCLTALCMIVLGIRLLEEDLANLGLCRPHGGLGGQTSHIL